MLPWFHGFYLYWTVHRASRECKTKRTRAGQETRLIKLHVHLKPPIHPKQNVLLPPQNVIETFT